MTYDQFNTIATQLGDGARVDVKIDGKWSYKGRFGFIHGIPSIKFEDGSSFWCVDDKAAGYIQELIIHSPQEPMKTVPKDKFDRIIELLTELGVEPAQEEKKVRKRWRAEKNGHFWLIQEDNDVYQDQDHYSDNDNKLYGLGNYYRTDEEAQAVADRNLAIQRVKDYILEHFGEWEPDWSDHTQSKYRIYYDHLNGKFDYDDFSYEQMFSPIGHLKEGHEAEQVIRDCEGDLLKILNTKK